MRQFVAKRDDNEAELVEALEAVGATVLRLSIRGVPDLLVGYLLATFLLEVKQSDGKGGAKRRGAETDARGLLETQQIWWSWWAGKPPVVVTTVEQALDAIGHPRCPRCTVTRMVGAGPHLRRGTIPRPAGLPDIPALVCDRCNWIREVEPDHGRSGHG